jgi:hypothetical protein
VENEREIVSCYICGHDRLRMGHTVTPCNFCDDPVIELNACASLIERAKYTTKHYSNQQPIINNYVQINVINFNMPEASEDGRKKLRDRINDFLTKADPWKAE